MRIAVIGALGIPSAGGGVNRHCEEVYARLAADGHRVVVFGRRTVTKTQTWRGVRVVALPVPRIRGVETVWYSLLATIAACVRPFDVVHYHSVVSTGFAKLPRLFGRRVAVTVHSFDRAHEKWGPFARSVLWWNERSAVRSADRILAVSGALAADLRARFPGLDVGYTPNGAPPPANPAPADALEPFGLRPDGYILFVGRLLPEKGLHLLAAAYARLRTDRELVVVGAPRYTDEYVEALQQAVPRVRLLGARTGAELDALYRHATAFVAPSLHEGFNITLLEAMSHGTPVIASDIPAHTEVLAGSGALFRSGDEHDLSRVLARVLNDDSLRASMSEAGIRRIRDANDYDWDVTAARVGQALSALLTSPDAE